MPGLIVSQHSGEGKANRYLPARLQPRSRHRLLHDGRRRAGQHADRRARPRLRRHQLPDPRAGQRRPVQEGTVLRGRGRLLGGRRRQHQLRQSARSPDRATLSAGERRLGPRVRRRRRRASAAAPARRRSSWTATTVRGCGRTTTGRSTACCDTAGATTATASRSPAWATGPTGIRPTRCRSGPSTSGLISAVRRSSTPPTAAARTARAWRPSVQRSTGPSSLRATGVRPAQQPEPVLELHLLPRRSGERRSVRAGRAAHGRRRPRHLPPARPRLRPPRRERGRRAGAPRLARPGGPLPHGRAQRLVDDARRRGRPDDGRRCTRRARSSGRARSGRRSGCAPTAISFDVTSDNPLNSGDGADGLVSPKFGAVFGPWRGTEFYANAGTGLSQQRRARRDDRRRSGHRRTGSSASRRSFARKRRGSRRAHRARPRPAVDGGAVVSRARLRAAVRRRRGHDRSGPAEPPRRRRVDQLRAAGAVADRGRRPVVLAMRASPTTIPSATAFPARSTA